MSAMGGGSALDGRSAGEWRHSSATYHVMSTTCYGDAMSMR